MSEGTPAMWMRGGTSKGLYFLKEDIPNNIAKREDFLLSVFGSPDNLQINGVGGGNPLTSKVAIVSKSKRSDIDVDYYFFRLLSMIMWYPQPKIVEIYSRVSRRLQLSED